MSHEDRGLTLNTSERRLFDEMVAERAIRNTLMRYFRGVDRKDLEMVASPITPMRTMITAVTKAASRA